MLLKTARSAPSTPASPSTNRMDVDTSFEEFDEEMVRIILDLGEKSSF